MKTAISLSKLLFSLLFILSATINFASALDVCRGQTITLAYNVSGVQSGQSCDAVQPAPGFISPGQPPVSGGSSSGSYQVTVPGNAPYGPTANFSLTCGLPPAQASGVDNLNVVNQASCCGVGSQVGLTVWNGSSCVAPVTWTDYCVPINDSNAANRGFVWQVSSSPQQWRAKTPTQTCSPCPSGQNWNNVSGAGAVCTPQTSGAPTLSVSRNPWTATVGTAFTVNWSSTNASAVFVSCSGPFSGSGALATSGSNSDVYISALDAAHANRESQIRAELAQRKRALGIAPPGEADSESATQADATTKAAVGRAGTMN
jgi:hypothetical protein